MKKLLIIAAIAAAGVGFYAYKKMNVYNDFVKYVTSKIGKIQGVKIDILTGKISFLLDLIFINPTNTPIDLSSGSLITLRKILIYNGANVLIASADTNINGISIPANGNSTISQIPFNTTISQVGGELQNILVPNYINTFSAKVEVTALGKTYILDAPTGLSGNLM